MQCRNPRVHHDSLTQIGVAKHIEQVTRVLRNTKDEIFVRGRAPQVPQLRLKEESTTTTESKEVCLELPRDLKQLTALCEQAPCGRGTETVLDTKVRKVLQTDKLDVQWDCLESVVQEVRARLCPWIGQLNAEFYKVLVYQPGDFFACHRDSKKTDRHVATLVVDLGLPCEGGDVVFPSVDPIQGADVTKARPLAVWDSRGTAGEWGCWFTSIYHRVRLLEKGTRVVVVYNLTMADHLIEVLNNPVVVVHTTRPATLETKQQPQQQQQQQQQQQPLIPLVNPCANNRVGGVLLNSSLASLVASYMNFGSSACFSRVNKQLRACLPRHLLLTSCIRSMVSENNDKLRRQGLTRLGFHLRHTYSFGQEGVCEPWQLKGCDRVLYDALRSCGLSPWMSSATLMKEERDSRVVTACLVKRVQMSDDRFAKDEEDPPRHDIYPETEYDGDLAWWSEEFEGVCWCASDDVGDLDRHFCLDCQEENSAASLWGNQSSFEMLAYSTGVLLADLPPPPVPVDRDVLPKKNLWKWQTESEEEEAEEGNEGEAEEGDEGEEEENEEEEEEEEEEETQEDRENLQALIDSVCRNKKIR